jgi:hypothetical protein
MGLWQAGQHVVCAGRTEVPAALLNQGLATCQTLLKPSPVLSPGLLSLAQ